MKNIIITRDFNYDESDFLFTYELLKNRYASSKSIIKYVTPSKLPSYEEHKNFILNKCLIA